jgi:hypothetical protein
MCPLSFRRKSTFDILEGKSSMELQNASVLDALAQRLALARRYLSGVDIPATAEEHAIVQIVKEDVPMLLAEILRFHPELRQGNEPVTIRH